MHAAKSAKPSGGDANALEVRQLNAPVVSDHDIFDMTLSIDQGANLPVCLI